MNQFTPTEPLRCAYCGTPISNLAGVTPGHSQTVRKGQIICCVVCCEASIVGESGLELVNEVRLQSLDPQTQRSLKITLDGLREVRGRATGQ